MIFARAWRTPTRRRAEQAHEVHRHLTVPATLVTYQVEHHVRQKYRCACNGAVVTAPGAAQVITGGRYAPAFGVAVAVAKYADHLPRAGPPRARRAGDQRGRNALGDHGHRETG